MAVDLRSADGTLEATYLPDAGMRCSSLRRRGTELLAAEDDIADPVLRSAMRGIPLLHPWANRLASDRYDAGGRTGELPREGSIVPRDGNGLAIHGLLAPPDAWEVAALGGSRLRAEMAFPPDPVRGAAFPFPHRLALEASLEADGLAVAVRLEPSGDVAVPVAFGFHPYLLPAGPRARWRVTLPARTHVETGADGLPSGRRVRMDPSGGGLPEATVDDAFVDLAPGAELAVDDGETRLALRLEAGFPGAHLYSPAGAGFICLEPETAPVNALVSGDGLAWVPPGERYEAAFRLTVGEGGLSAA